MDRLQKTDCGHGLIQAARSIPDIGIGRLGVGNVASILRIAAPASGQERNFANGRYLAAYESGDNEHREGRIKTMRVPSRGIPRDDENSKGAGLAFGL